MNRALLDFWVGLFVLLGLLALVFLALKVANQSTLNSSNAYSVTASFHNIGGLKVRAPIKSAGVTVGRVTAIGLDDTTYRARVTLSIEEGYHFSSDSSAGIFTSGLLGEQYVNLEAGGETDMLQDGDVITFTSSALVLENLIGKFVTGISSTGDK